MCQKFLNNHKYGKLKPLKIARKNKFGAKYWICQCDCGNIKEIRQHSFTSGSTISCGCVGKKRSIEAHTLPNNTAALNSLYNSYKRVANNKNREFNLTLADFKELTSRCCYYCDKPPQQEMKTYSNTPSYFYNGLDRIDNNQGYTEKNVLTSCGRCNKLRNNELSVEETKLLIMTLMDFRKNNEV